jgi:TPR repeat protein
MHVLGIRPDPEQAQAWYARAAEYGSGEAKHLLAAAGNVAR